MFITGGAGAIGAATAARFLEEGARVVLLDRDEDALTRIGRKLPALSGAIAADVADAGAVARAFEELDGLVSGLDVLINNAGISIRHRFMDISPQEWRRVMRVNLDGVFFVAQEAARRMLAARGGVILNMGSTNGLMGYHYYADYNASKAAVVMLTRSLAAEWAPRGVRVNCISPGYILTEMNRKPHVVPLHGEWTKRTPMGRLGEVEDLMAAVVYLASRASSFATGAELVIDGGYTLW